MLLVSGVSGVWDCVEECRVLIDYNDIVSRGVVRPSVQPVGVYRLERLYSQESAGLACVISLQVCVTTGPTITGDMLTQNSPAIVLHHHSTQLKPR